MISAAVAIPNVNDLPTGSVFISGKMTKGQTLHPLLTI
jgi:hypothetical protein